MVDDTYGADPVCVRGHLHFGPIHTAWAVYLHDLLGCKMLFLKKLLKNAGREMERFGKFVAFILFSVLYYTVFALFAIPARLFGNIFSLRGQTTFRVPRHQYQSLDSFREEG